MVAGKVKVAMGFTKSPSPAHVHSTPPPQKKKQQQQPPPPSPSTTTTTSSTKSSSHKSSFSRIGFHFPRSSAQVQPRPPDGTELLRLVEELRESESRLKTELLEHKLLKESIAIVPVLENELTARETEIQRSRKKAEETEAENEKLKNELKELKLQMEDERRESKMKMKALEDEIAELKKTTSLHNEHEHEQFSSSQRFLGIGEVSVKSNLMKNLKKTMSDHAIVIQKQNEIVDLKRDFAETERTRHSRCNSEELIDCTDSVLNINVRSRVPRVPNPPPKPSSSSSSASSSSSSSSGGSVAEDNNNNGETEQTVLQPIKPAKAAPPPPPPPPSRKPTSKAAAAPAPPPPPPPPKGGRMAPAKVRRVPEVVEFYHSLMRRDSQSRRESNSGAAAEVPATANARDMIGEIENRSTHLLAVSTREFRCVIYYFATVVIYVSIC
jgi:myosin heavy subunit